MKEVTSRDNPLFKRLRQIAGNPAFRRKSGNTLLEGVHLCQAYLEQNNEPQTCIVAQGACRQPEIAHLLARVEQGRVECVCLQGGLYREITQLETGVGIFFVIALPEKNVPARLDSASVLLDRLQDPGNLGSILRSAAAAGIECVYCSDQTASIWSPKVLRAGMGAHFLLDIFENVDLQDLISEAEIDVFATSSYAAQNLYELDLRKPVAWIFGNEGQGVDVRLLEMANARVKIPHRGAVESLNAAASAAVCLFEWVRQNQVGRAVTPAGLPK